MIKELIARVIQPTTNTVVSESIEPEDIHEKIRKGILQLLTDAGFPNVAVTIGPQGGCTHERCILNATVYYQNVPTHTANELVDTFYRCAENAARIVFNEVLGPSELIDMYCNTTIEPVKHKGKQ